MLNHDISLTSKVTIHASLARVWEVMTKPDIIKKYLFGTHTTTDWQPGSEVVFQGDYNGRQYRDHGKILENIPLKKISYTYWTNFNKLDDKPENYSTITYLLEQNGDDLTDLSWIQKGFTGDEAYKHSQEGMPAFMNKIKAIAEE